MYTKILLLSLLLLNYTAVAQRGLEFTSTISPAYSCIFNQEDINDVTQERRPSFGVAGKITAGYNFTGTVGISSGIGISHSSQHYVKSSTKNTLTAFQETSSRTFSYFRIPVLLRLSSSPENKHSFFMRFGLHLDLLMTAIGQTKYPVDYNKEDDYIDYTSLKTPAYKDYKVYRPVVLGVSLDLGAKIGLTDEIGLLLMAHLETNLTNTEGETAPLYLSATTKTIVRDQSELVVFERSNTFNLLAGISIGVIYNPITYTITNRNYQKRKGRRLSRWR